MRYRDAQGVEQEVRPGRLALFGGIGGILLILAMGTIIGGCQSLDSTGPGEVAVVYNGGPFDSKDVRTTYAPSSGPQIPGLASEWRKYPEAGQQRYFRVTPDDLAADNPGTEIVVPTEDGVQVSIEALVNFSTVFTGEADDEALRAFDDRFGNRTFGDKHVYDDDGFAPFLNAQVGPVIVSTFRDVMEDVECEDLVSACALIQQTGNGTVQAVAPGADDASLSKIEVAVQERLDERIDAALGGHFLEGWQVNVEVVRLPEDVQTGINAAQAEFAEISKQRASAKAAEFEAERTRILAEQYSQNPEYAQIKSVESCAASQNCQIILGTQGLGLNVGK